MSNGRARLSQVAAFRLSDQTGELKCDKLDEGEDVDEGLLTDEVRLFLLPPVSSRVQRTVNSEHDQSPVAEFTITITY